MLARFFDLLVLGEAVGVLRARGIVLLSQDLSARRGDISNGEPSAWPKGFITRLLIIKMLLS